MSGVEGGAGLAPFVSRLAAGWVVDHPDERYRCLAGTLVSADLSGFTAMSERLAGKGKEGSEELTAAVNLCFTALIDDAESGGGDVLKFGGDALLVWFDGDGHERRAVQAMAAMQRTIGARRFARLGLRMSVGGHSGEFDLFLLGGEEHRELVLLGASVSAAVTAEATATAGEVLVTPATAAAVPPGWVRDGYVDVDAVDPLPPPGPSARAAPAVAASLVAPVLRSEIEALAGLPGEHRMATVVFVELEHTDDAIAVQGPEVFGRRLEAMVLAAQRRAAQYGLLFLYSDVLADGVKLLLVAGAPRSSEDDEEAAVRFATELVAGDPLGNVRAGVNRGRVFAGFLGAPGRRTYTVMGDPVNLAARLMAKAIPGEVVVSAATMALVGADFEQRPLEPFLVKGKTEPIHAAVVGRHLGVRIQARGERVPLVGRDDELRVLLDAVGAAVDGRGQAVDLLGEAGIGKSRLVEAVADDPRVEVELRVNCQPYDQARPYAAVRALVRQALGIAADADPVAAGAALVEAVDDAAPDQRPLLPLLADAIGAAVEPTPESGDIADEFRADVTQQVADAVLGAVLRRPTLLSIEDVEHLDDASLQILRHLASRIHDRPWVLVTGRRPETPAIAGERGRELVLAPLDKAATEHLATLSLGELVVPAGDLRGVLERCGGNPLFALELLSAIEAGESVDALPESIERVVAANVDRLPPADRLLLRHASVVGSTFAVPLVEAILAAEGEQAVDPSAFARMPDLLDPLPTGDYRFRHALYRDVAYEGLPFRRRRHLHATVGTLLESEADPDVALLSQHFHLAGDHAKAWIYSVDAGRMARRLSAFEEVVRCLDRAIQARSRLRDVEPDPVAEVMYELAQAHRFLGRTDDAQKVLDRGLRLRGSSAHMRARLCQGRASLELWKGDLDGFDRWNGRAVALLERSSSEGATLVKAEILEAEAQAWHQRGDRMRQREVALRALEAAEVAGNRASEGGAHLLLMLAALAGAGGDVLVHGDAALAAFEAVNDQVSLATVLNNIGIAAYYDGDWSSALERYQAAAQRAGRAGDSKGSALAEGNELEILGDQGHWDDAIRRFEAVRRCLAQAGYRYGELAAAGNLGRTLARFGEHDEAIRQLGSTIEGFETLGAADFVEETRARIAEAHALAGRGAEAISVGREVLARAGEVEVQPTTLPLAWRAVGWGHELLGERDAAVAAFRSAVAVAEAGGAAAEAVFARFGLAHLTGDEALLAAVSEELDGLGVVQLAEVARGLVPPGRPTGPRSPGC